MLLRDAITKALKFTLKVKQRSPAKSVRFLPRHDGTRAAVYATNGPQAILIWVDDTDLPNVMIDGEKLSAAIKGTKEVRFDSVANGTVSLSGVRLEGGNVAEYPSTPPMPEEAFKKVDDWWAIEKVLHVVSRDHQDPALRCLHFRKDMVETTDRFRVARAFVETPWEALVPSQIFSHWPAGDVSASFGPGQAVFMVGDEMRFTVLKSDLFVDCDPLLPACHDGPRVAVPTDQLIASLKRLKPLSDNSVLHLSPKEVRLEGGGYSDSLNTTFALDAPEEPSRMAVNTAWFLESLQNVSTGRVLLGYTMAGELLRVESGPLVVGIWPFG